MDKGYWLYKYYTHEHCLICWLLINFSIVGHYVTKIKQLETDVNVPHIKKRKWKCKSTKHLSICGAPEFTYGFWRVARSLVVYVLVYRSMIILLSLFPLVIVLCFFDLRILITPLVSSNSSFAQFHTFCLIENNILDFINS